MKLKFSSFQRWLHSSKIAERLSGWLRQDAGPEKLAFSIALAFVFGVCPVFGAPTVLCGLAAAVWRLNFPALQFVNYLVYPLQLALLWPFAWLGELLFGAVRSSHGLASSLSAIALHTAAAWLCFAVPAGLMVYFLLRQVLRRQRNRIACPTA